MANFVDFSFLVIFWLVFIGGWGLSLMEVASQKFPNHSYIWTPAPVRFGLRAMVVAVSVWSSLYVMGAGQGEDYWNNVYVEFGGAIFDVFIFGVLLAGAVSWHDRQQEIQRQQEIIDDFKKWNGKEGNLRIAGAIRRLNRLGITAIDFRGIEIEGFGFKRNDIKSIAGSNFYDGQWGETSSREGSKLTKVSFGQTDCRGVVFSPYSPLLGLLGKRKKREMCFEDCSFIGAHLQGAKFDGASLVWSNKPPDSHMELMETDPDTGQPFYAQMSYSHFANADLTGASFRDCIFKNADFRDADWVETADFRGATGLGTCVFDEGDLAKIQAKMKRDDERDAKKKKEDSL